MGARAKCRNGWPKDGGGDDDDAAPRGPHPCRTYRQSGLKENSIVLIGSFCRSLGAIQRPPLDRSEPNHPVWHPDTGMGPIDQLRRPAAFIRMKRWHPARALRPGHPAGPERHSKSTQSDPPSVPIGVNQIATCSPPYLRLALQHSVQDSVDALLCLQDPAGVDPVQLGLEALAKGPVDGLVPAQLFPHLRQSEQDKAGTYALTLRKLSDSRKLTSKLRCLSFCDLMRAAWASMILTSRV